MAISIDSVSVDDPSGPQDATADFTVLLDASNPTETVTVDYSTVDGTAKAGVDYTPVNGTLTFAPGVTSQSIDVAVFSSPTSAPDPTFYVALSDPVNDTLAPSASEGAALILAAPATATATAAPATPVTATAAPATAIATSASTTATPTTPVTATAAPATATATSASTTATPATETTTPASTTAGTEPAASPPAVAASSGSTSSAQPSSAPPAPGTPVPAGVVVPVTSAPVAPASATAATVAPTDPLAVTNTNDSGPGSLRSALQYADANPGGPPITFDIEAAGPIVITPRTPLPAITHPLTIDATTQPGYAGAPIVVINGAQAGPGTSGLVITGGGSVVRGLAIEHFSGSAIVLQSGGGNTIEGDDLGTDSAGTTGTGNASDGVRIDGSADNSIGGTAAGDGNVIAGNGLVGVRIEGAGAFANVVQGNLIGTSPNGSSALGNGADGIFIDGASGNIIGGSSTAARNVISANGSVGVEIEGTTASDNQVLDNLIGTDGTGADPLGNGRDGMFLDGAPGNTIAGNAIDASGQAGLQLFGRRTRANIVAGNVIGGGTGDSSLGNPVGLFVNDAPGNTTVMSGAAANTIVGNVRANVLPASAAGRNGPRDAAVPASPALSLLAPTGNQNQGSNS